MVSWTDVLKETVTWNGQSMCILILNFRPNRKSRIQCLPLSPRSARDLLGQSSHRVRAQRFHQRLATHILYTVQGKRQTLIAQRSRILLNQVSFKPPVANLIDYEPNISISVPNVSIIGPPGIAPIHCHAFLNNRLLLSHPLRCSQLHAWRPR